MYLIEKGKRPRKVCMECFKVHSRANCPKVQERREEQARIRAMVDEAVLWNQRRNSERSAV
jgi:hypothetical protein